jgi:hypothetical protein
MDKDSKLVAESYFGFVNLILEADLSMLTYAAVWDLHFNQDHRKHITKELKDRIIEDLDSELWHLDPLRADSKIAKTLYAVTTDVKSVANILKAICETGKFTKGWEDRLKMFEQLEMAGERHIRAIENAFKDAVAPYVKDEVLTDLSKQYFNPFRDTVGARKMDAHKT